MEDWSPDESVFKEAEKLWDEGKQKRHQIMDGKIRDGICYMLTLPGAEDNPMSLAQRAAWLGYCIGAGLIKEGESDVG